MKWYIDSDRPIYKQLVEQIELRIISGVYAPGDKLESVREMAMDAGVNPNTMQKALGELENKGLLYTQRTSGRFVTEDTQKIEELRSALAAALALDFVKGMQALGCKREEISSLIKQAEEEI